MRRGFVKVIALAFVVVMAAFPVQAANPVVTEKYLNVPSYTQKPQTNWCWAVSYVTVMAYHGLMVGTCAFVSYVVNNDVSQPCPDVGGDLAMGQKGLTHWGFSSSQYSSALGFASMQSEIDALRPFTADWFWTNGGGHTIVVDGYYQETMGTTLVAQEVRYMDPLDGQYYRKTYSSFVSDTDHKWTRGLLSIQ